MPGCDVILVDADGKQVPPDEPGELLVRGRQVMQGYWQRPDETATALQNGWFATGDIAVMDGQGFLKIVDRKKDLVLVSGFTSIPMKWKTRLPRWMRCSKPPSWRSRTRRP